jgi:preprotein translocase subunit YajC
MSQRTYLIVLTIAIIYFLAICQSADAKRKRQERMEKNIRSHYY